MSMGREQINKGSNEDPELSTSVGWVDYPTDAPWFTDREKQVSPDDPSVEKNRGMTEKKKNRAISKSRHKQLAEMDDDDMCYRRGEVAAVQEQGESNPNHAYLTKKKWRGHHREQNKEAVTIHVEEEEVGDAEPKTTSAVTGAFAVNQEREVRRGGDDDVYSAISEMETVRSDYMPPPPDDRTVLVEAQLAQTAKALAYAQEQVALLEEENVRLRHQSAPLAHAEVQDRTRKRRCLIVLGVVLVVVVVAVVAATISITVSGSSGSEVDKATTPLPTTLSTSPPTPTTPGSIPTSVPLFNNTVSLRTIVPSGGVCDYQHYIVETDTFVCEPREPGDEYLIQFDGPSKTWDGLPNSITMVYRASGILRISATGTFEIDATIVSIDYESDITGGGIGDFGIGDSVSTSCLISIDGENVGADCGDMWVQEFENVEGGHVCRLNYGASIVTPPQGPFKQLELTFDIPPTIQDEWETVCGSGSKEYIWFERYYFSGFTTYNHRDTVLSVS